MRKTAFCALVGAAILISGSAGAQEPVAAPDLLTFAAGALPVSIQAGPADLRVGSAQAISLIDGNPVGFVLTPKPTTGPDRIEIIYSLPAPTRFDRFAVPNITETPSPSQTFVRHVEVLGAVASPQGPFLPLAQIELAVHEGDGLTTELPLAPEQPEVLFVKVRLSGGLDVQRDTTFLEFSELVGNGTQQTARLSDGFDGVWSGRGVKMELAQEGPSVTGCYDGRSKLSGTVEGNVLRALGADSAGVPSQFILIATRDGGLSGLRSTNGAPFKPYDGTASDKTPVCLAPEPPGLGCGSVVHGIGFDFDSDVIRPESQPVLDMLFAGLDRDGAQAIEIIGHSSSEGAEDYNRDLSQRRAGSVVAALVERGLDVSGLSATGRGEDDPIASNADEAGRSLNRRVEIVCRN